MPRSRSLVLPLLIGALSLPTGAVLAQNEVSYGWSVGDDGLVFGTNDSLDELPGWSVVGPADFPPPIAGLPGPDQLYRIDRTAADGTRIAGLHDATTLPWLDEGRTPLLAKAVVDDGGATWTRQQHIISTPAGCSAAESEMGSCVHPSLIAALADLAVPAGSPVGPAPFADDLGLGHFVSTGVTDRDGTLFSFAGGATVGTTVKVGVDDTIVVNGSADIGDGLGGQLRGYDTLVIETPANGSDFIEPPGWGSLESRARDVRAAWLDRGKTMRRALRCPASRNGYVLSQFLIGGAGRNVGSTVDSNLEGGIPVLISEVIPFDCGPTLAPNPGVLVPDGGPVAAFACGSTRARHMPFRWTHDGTPVTSPSTLEELFAFVTLGLPPATTASLELQVGGANGDQFISVGLEGTPLDSAAQPDAMLWLGSSIVGIESYGPKEFRDLTLVTDTFDFDLLDQKREQFGDAFVVGPSQKAVTNCPGFDFTPGDVGMIFPGGFEAGDVSAWAEPIAD